MRRDDVRFAAAARDDGIRKISKYTWRVGAAGVLCSAVIAVAFGHHVSAQPPAPAHTGNGSTSSGGSSSSSGSSSGGGGGGSSSSSSSGTNGGGSSTNSGGGTNGGGASNQGQGTIVVPAQPPAPASGGGQVISGAS
jgi:hypothetical protein